MRALFFLLLTVFMTGCGQSNDDKDNYEKRLKALESKISRLVSSQEQDRHTNQRSVNECLIQGIQNSKIESNGEFLREACIRRASVELPDTLSLQESTATFEVIHGGYDGYKHVGLYINLNNKSQYNISQLTVAIKNIKTGKSSEYQLQKFRKPLAADYVGRKIEYDLAIPPGSQVFVLETTEYTDDPKKFFEEFSWGITKAWGYRD